MRKSQISDNIRNISGAHYFFLELVLSENPTIRLAMGISGYKYVSEMCSFSLAMSFEKQMLNTR